MLVVIGTSHTIEHAIQSVWENTVGRLTDWAAGWEKEDFRKPIITVACPWTNATPCNNHFRELGDVVCEEVEKAGRRKLARSAPSRGC